STPAPSTDRRQRGPDRPSQPPSPGHSGTETPPHDSGPIDEAQSVHGNSEDAESHDGATRDELQSRRSSHLDDAQSHVSIIRDRPQSRDSTPAPSHSERVSQAAPDAPSPIDEAVNIIEARETRAGRDFLRRQGEVYRRTGNQHPEDVSEQTGTGNFTPSQMAAWLVQCIGRPTDVLAPCKAGGIHDMIASHATQPWRQYLAKPPRPLSLFRAERRLPDDEITVKRVWDIDSIWLGATSLQAILPNNTFRLSVLPPYKQSLSGDQIIQPHGVDLGHTRHTLLGSFSVGSLNMAVFILFPNAMVRRSQVQGKPCTLSLERQKDLLDGAIIPAIVHAIPAHFRQEIPPSFAIAHAKQMSYQEKTSSARWRADDENRAAHLRYGLPGQYLGPLWSEIENRCNQLLVRTTDQHSPEVPYFKCPRLLFQVHDTKNVIAGASVADALGTFCDIVLAHLNPTFLDFRSCWIDIGMRDMPSRYTNAAGNQAPMTLLWKRSCNDHYHRVVQAASPDISFNEVHFRSFNLRDVATYTSKARSAPQAEHRRGRPCKAPGTPISDTCTPSRPMATPKTATPRAKRLHSASTLSSRCTSTGRFGKTGPKPR
ncbi:Uncharacterized protein TPAR_00363, partial [Tolypocladium paradoxum]